MPRLGLAAVLALSLLLPQTTLVVSAAGDDRTLYLHHTHTDKTMRFTYKRDGKFDSKVLKELNVFLADWRTGDPTKMDPALFDLLWSVYNEVGGREPINIVSSYRTPKTNKMLASRSDAVADNSLHMAGKALDFFIPGVSLKRLREVAMKHQVGGVGYYPTSGSPFVHLDTGSVRAWPRMTRTQLAKLFPDGRTLHVPTDGKVLSQEGRAYAQAQWTKCHTVPCNGEIDFTVEPGIMVADAAGGVAPIPMAKPAGLYEDEEARLILASLEQQPGQRLVASVAIEAPIPLMRPTRLTGDGGTALDALKSLDGPDERMVTAYVDPLQDPEAQLALKMIIERETTAALPRALAPTGGPATGAGTDMALRGMFDLTFDALSDEAPAAVATAVAELAEFRRAELTIATRATEFVAPELDHVAESLVHPVPMTDAHWAVMTGAEGYLDKATELGPLTAETGFVPETAAIEAYDSFVAPPLLVALR